MKTRYGDEEYTEVRSLPLPPGLQLSRGPPPPDMAAVAGSSNGRPATGTAPVRPQRPRKSESVKHCLID